MTTATSRDGTTIAYRRTGHDGPAVVLVSGALSVRGDEPFVLETLLAEAGFSAYAYNRRGRVDSGDTPPYAVEREIEDLAAVIDAAGGTAYVYGMSSGGHLALRAARELPQITKVGVYEPPTIVDDSRPPLPDDYVARLDAASPDEALTIFLCDAIGMPASVVDQMKAGPGWSAMLGVAHTLAYDGRVVGDAMSGRPLAAIPLTIPALVVTGGASEAWMRDGVKAVAGALPNATFAVLDGQDHNVDHAMLAPLLIEFLRRS